jgi:hypothetical protein
MYLISITQFDIVEMETGTSTMPVILEPAIPNEKNDALLVYGCDKAVSEGFKRNRE